MRIFCGWKMIVYTRLWDKMKENQVSQYRLIKEGISTSTLTRLKRNENISTDTINKLCLILHCRVEDIMEFVEE